MDHRLWLLTLGTRLGCRLPNFQNIWKPSKNWLQSVATGFFIYIRDKNLLIDIIYSFLLQHNGPTLTANVSRLLFFKLRSNSHHIITTTQPSLWHHPPMTTITTDHKGWTNEGLQHPMKTNTGPQQPTTRVWWQIIGLKKCVTQVIFFCIYPLY